MNHPDKGCIYLLAYPRSGSNWLRYCFEFITKRKAVSRESAWQTGAKPPELLYHAHSVEDYNLGEITDNNYRTILLLRNYKECVFSHLITASYFKGFTIMSWDVKEHLKDYYELVKYYDQFGESDNNIIILYEDFIQNPFLVLNNLIEYLLHHYSNNFDAHILYRNLEELEKNISFHREQCLKGYRGSLMGTEFSGNAFSSTADKSDVKFYSKSIGRQSDLKKVDEFLEKLDSELFDKYLSHYKESE